jgi:transmembrane sensor
MTAARKSAAEIDAEAAMWVARRDAAHPAAGDQVAFEAWLGDDPRHLGAYARAEAVFARFDRLRVPQAPESETTPEAVNRRAVLGWFGLAAAAIAGIILVPRAMPATGQDYVSATGELRQIALADGSRMTLGTDSAATVTLADGDRRVLLLRGSALFDVAPDKRRPFTVQAGPVRVTALGTSFSVLRDGAGGRLVVREGRVAVVQAGNPQSYRAAAGARAVWTGTGSVRLTALTQPELRRELAWTQGMLAFEGESLAQAAAAFARYSRLRIIIDDPALARRKVTGWFATSDPRGFAHAAATSLGAVAEDRGDSVIIRPAA